MTGSPCRLLIVLLALLFSSLPERAAHTTALAILQRFYQASGGKAWQHFAECDSTGTVTFAGKPGTIRYVEDLRTGGNRSNVEIPALSVKQANGNGPAQSWNQDAAGDIQLSNSADPNQIDDRYLTSRAYWQPRFGGAAVTLLEPQTQGTSSWDRLQFKVPRGHGFTLWINRQTGLLDRIQGDGTKQLSDYRRIQGVLLPFLEKKPASDSELIVTFTSRILREHLDNTAFAIPFRTDYKMPPSGEVTVPAEGGLVFDAMINSNGPFRAVFDTGSINLMSETLAHKLGLKLETEEVQVSTYSAATIPARRAHISTLQIGDLVLHDQTFLVAAIPDDAEEGTPSFVVGYEILRRFAVRVDYEHQMITLYDGARFHYAGHGSAVPLRIQGTNILADGSIGDASGTFLLDTGNEFGFFTSTGFTQKYDLVHALNAHFFGYNGRGYGGPSPEAYLARVDTMRLGNVPVASIIAHLTTDPSDTSQPAGNIGQSILGQFTDVFDCMRGQLYLERSSDTGKPEGFNRAGLILDVLDDGLQIMTVLPGSPGAEAGLQKGDVITAIDGKPSSDDVKQPAFLQPPGCVLHLSVRRGKETHDVVVTLKDIL